MDQAHRFSHGICQVAQLVFRMVIQLKFQISLLERTALVGNVDDRFYNVLQNVLNQAEQTYKRKGQADRAQNVHGQDHLPHFGGAVQALLSTVLNDLIQKSYQCGQVGEDRILIVSLCL